MKNTWFWLIAVAAVLALSGTTHAGSPPVTMLLLPLLFGDGRPGGRSGNGSGDPAHRPCPPCDRPSAGLRDAALSEAGQRLGALRPEVRLHHRRRHRLWCGTAGGLTHRGRDREQQQDV